MTKQLGAALGLSLLITLAGCATSSDRMGARWDSLSAQLVSSDPHTRASALAELRKRPNDSGGVGLTLGIKLKEAVEAHDQPVILSGGDSLVALGPEVISNVVTGFNINEGDSPGISDGLARVMAKFGPAGVPAMIDFIRWNERDQTTRGFAESVLVKIGKPAVPYLVEHLGDGIARSHQQAYLCQEMMGVAAAMGPVAAEAVPAVAQWLKPYSSETRSTYGPPVNPWWQWHLAESLREAAASALPKLGPRGVAVLGLSEIQREKKIARWRQTREEQQRESQAEPDGSTTGHLVICGVDTLLVDEDQPPSLGKTVAVSAAKWALRRAIKHLTLSSNTLLKFITPGSKEYALATTAVSAVRFFLSEVQGDKVCSADEIAAIQEQARRYQAVIDRLKNLDQWIASDAFDPNSGEANAWLISEVNAVEQGIKRLGDLDATSGMKLATLPGSTLTGPEK